MDEFEDLKIKTEIDEIARKIDSIMQRVEAEDPGVPPGAPVGVPPTGPDPPAITPPVP